MNSSDDGSNNPQGGCSICGEIREPNHLNSERHQLNHLLYGLNKCRKAISKDRGGVEIKVTTNNEFSPNRKLQISNPTNRGEYISTLSEEEIISQREGISFNFEVSVKESIILMHSDKIHPYDSFIFQDMDNILNRSQIPELERGTTYSVQLKLQAKNIGEYRMPIHFQFQTLDKKPETFSIVKEMVIYVTGRCPDFCTEIREKSPFTNKEWARVYTYVPPTHNSFFVNQYEIPKEYFLVFMYCFKRYNGITRLEDEIRIRISSFLNQRLSPNIYKDFFHYLLWLDEAGAIVHIRNYNMENVTLKIIQDNIVELDVPGLAEKRPSLIKGDIVNIREHDGSVAYQGIIKEVRDKNIWIKEFNPHFLNIVANIPGKLYDVRFDISRLPFERMHRAIDLCIKENKLDILFPNKDANHANKNRIYKMTDAKFKNPAIRTNQEQKEAVTNILNNSSRNAPFIIFGPPGTGKTVTIVEAIYQIVKHMPSSNILVCAPANAACDMLTIKLAKYFNTKELIRIHSDSVDWNSIPEEVKKYSNRKDNNQTVKITGSVLHTYKIVVTTLMSAGRFAEQFTASHVFIDEAAQAEEPQAIISIGGILKKGGQIVLAGDPKQLGPICNSREAKERGLEISLLKRLMDLSLYQSTNPDYKFFMTKLILNYRNHPDILRLPNELFYENELIPKSTIPLIDPINKVILLDNTKKSFKPQAIEFCGVNGKESREGRSPSYFNLMEIHTVIKYLLALTDPNANAQVKANEIGIVTPYIRQVYRLRNRLPDDLKEVEIGTTETFQGREKRVIIISTVRAQSSLLEYDKKYNIGFVNNPQRFNVATTRAISKLIVVGNPQCLNTDKNWYKLIELCRSLNSYTGFYIGKRDLAMRNAIREKVSNVKYNTPNTSKNRGQR